MYQQQEQGRSMVEIIGVITIMGLLSFGALRGYDALTTSNDSNKIITSAGEVYAIAKVKGHTTKASRERLSKTLPNIVQDIEVTPQGCARVQLIKCIEKDVILNIQARYGYPITIPSDMKNSNGSLKLIGEERSCSFQNSNDLFEIIFDLTQQGNCDSLLNNDEK